MNNKIISVIIIFIILLLIDINTIVATNNIVIKRGYQQIVDNDKTIDVFILFEETSKKDEISLSANDFVYDGNIKKLSEEEILKRANVKVNGAEQSSIKLYKSSNRCISECDESIIKYTIISKETAVSIFLYKETKNSVVISHTKQQSIVDNNIKNIVIKNKKYQILIPEDHLSSKVEINEIQLEKSFIIFVSSCVLLSAFSLIGAIIYLQRKSDKLVRLIVKTLLE